ncbi:unnamed protein product [Taenia asiatica]|uniref:Exodeoxyribonuclease V n=1 Tax=Taenia asiatica TaxID=60517 RepID=A0A0R3WG43_TAEAS|nr:unnamed protein product [Taenia asiatica]
MMLGRVLLRLRKLDLAEFGHHCSLLPQNAPQDRTFDKTAKSLKQHFGDQPALFPVRHEIADFLES